MQQSLSGRAVQSHVTRAANDAEPSLMMQTTRPRLCSIDRGGRSAAAPVAVAAQTTVGRPVSMDGVGLHTGRTVRLVLCPAPAGSGVVFRRTDLRAVLPARYDMVADTRLCTLLASPDDAALRVGTVEHLMAALAAMRVDNAVVEIDGPELPIGDGSARGFVALIARAGVVEQAARRQAVVVRRPVRVAQGEAFASLVPGDGFSMLVLIDFEAPAIGRQSLRLEALSPATFRAELADCRTFTMADDIERLRASGLARGGSLDNAVVVDGASVLNPEGLRRPDEFVRHKALDVVGDLALAGHPIEGRFVGHRCGHELNNRLLRALFADAANWALADAIAPARVPSSRAA